MNKDLMIDALEYIDPELIEESSFQKQKRLRLRKIFVVLAAAVLVMACTLSAVARNEWDIDLMNYMGLDHATTKQLANGVVQIDASDSKTVDNQLTGTEEDITLNASSSIGDDKNAYVKIETNMEIPEGYEYVLPDEWNLSVHRHDNDITEDHAGELECMNKDGKVYFVMKIEDAEHLNRDYVDLSLGDIYAYKNNSDADGILLYEDTWNMSWKYSYKSNKAVSHPCKMIMVGEQKMLLTKIVITPLEVKAYARAFTESQEEIGDQFRIEKITLKDGTVIRFDTTGGSGYSGCRYFYRYSTYCSLETEDRTVNPKKVESVSVNGVEVQLRV